MMIAYKLFSVRKDGSIGSLFINRKIKLPKNEWLEAETHPTNGYKLRPFWHCCLKPIAPHLTLNGRKWYRVEIKDYIEMVRPTLQGGTWLLAKKIKILGEVKNLYK